MAFTDTLSQPQNQIGIQGGVRGSNPLEGISGLFDNVANKVGAHRAEQERLEIGRAQGNAQVSILDLEDERNNVALQDQQLSAQMQEMASDGLTADEQEIIKGLEAQRAKLKEARRSGVLNPLNYQTRLNALQRSALANVDNLAIQPQINSIFSQARSNISAPIPTAQAKFEQNMDELYGVNNWSGADAGLEQGKALNLERIRVAAAAKFESFVGQESLAYMLTADSAVRTLRTAKLKNGSINDNDIDQYMGAINNRYQKMIQEIDVAVVNNRKNGVPVDMEQVEKSKARVELSYKFYTSLVQDKQEFGDDAKFGRRIENMNKLVASLNSANNAGMAQFAAAVGGSGGTGGDLAVLVQLASAPDSLLQGVTSSLEGSPLEISTSALREQAAAMVAKALNPFNFQDAVDKGLVNRQLAQLVASMSVKTSDNPISLNNFIPVLGKVDWSAADSGLKVLIQSENNLRANKADIKRVGTSILNISDTILSNITEEEAKHVSVNKDGVIQIGVPDDSVSRLRASRVGQSYTNKTLKSLNDAVARYADVIGDPVEFRMDLLNRIREKGGSKVVEMKEGAGE